MSICVLVDVYSNSSLKQVGYVKPNFTWNEVTFIEMIQVICYSSV